MASMKIASILAAATLVAGHGYVTNATIGGSSYEFYQPYTDPYTSPTPERVSRPIQGNGPVTDVTLADLQCGGDSADGVVGSSPAALQAGPVAAGSDVELFWTLWPSSHVGPTITYMAKCPDTGCTDYMPNNTAVWFKVQEDGRDGTSDTWGATPLMTAGGSVKYTIPECIEAGDYLVRHEIIALHSAYSYPGAQFYPGCHQIQVTGGGSTSPSNLVSFPGAYKGSDAGITYDAYKAQTYTIPGPELFTCSGSSSSSSSSSSGSSSSAAAATSATTAQASSAPSTLATVTRASSATSSAVAVAAASATTSAVSGDDEDGCGAEETVTSTISAAAAVVTGSGDDGDDECGADEPTTTATASAATATSSDDGGDDDECGADEPTGVVTGSAATTTDSADGSGDDDECGAEEPTATASTSATSTTSSDDGGDDDECGAEEPTATATGSAASATASAASGDDDECDAEEESAYARRFSGRFARVAV
ncbi:Cellulose-growth-specific protein [Cytospora mali]|uniref:lytic cellulose monooxygenase (C4-dehydrogenating) n=1 Tax=Cytospora mali TaxID=578113 RepID=A0A194VKA8_CYTMA|nr:Cellulose-growth-specific protein [Valsa mali]